MAGGRSVRDGGAKPGQVIERDGGKHVVLDMMLHVPVEKRGQPAAGEGAAAKAMVRHVGRKAVVLRRAAEGREPAAIKDAEVEHDDEEPVSRRDEKRSQREMAEDQDARPGHALAAQGGIGFRDDLIEPVGLKIPARPAARRGNEDGVEIFA